MALGAGSVRLNARPLQTAGQERQGADLSLPSTLLASESNALLLQLVTTNDPLAQFSNEDYFRKYSGTVFAYELVVPSCHCQASNVNPD